MVLDKEVNAYDVTFLRLNSEGDRAIIWTTMSWYTYCKLFFKYYFRGILAFIGQRQCRQTERERHAAKGCRSDSNSGCYFLSHARLLTH